MVKLILVLALTAVVLMAFSFGYQKPNKAQAKPLPAGRKELYVAGGCFWCVEGMFEQLKGVDFVESGYAGGNRAGVSYEEVCSGATGHAEVVRIVFDPKAVDEADLLRIFFTVHNPTTLNRQGPDVGTQYRSAMFFRTPEEKALMQKVRDEISAAKVWKDPIVTTLEPLKNYTAAEEYHQNYFEKFEKGTLDRTHANIGYCTAVIEPHVLEFRKMYAARLKKH